MSRVAKTVEPPETDGRSSKDLGRQLRQVRRNQGLSRAEVARSAGLTRRELAAYERGRIVIPESDLWCLAGSCGVDVNELLPDRTPLRIGSGLSSLAMGDSIRRLREPGQPDGLLREYLSMVYELRNLPPGSRIPLRESDLATLADALGGTPDVIEEQLIELIGASHEEAARLRAMILPPLSLPSGLPSSTDPYAAYGASDEHSPVVDFFSTPRAQDPFSTQLPSLDTSAPPVGAPVPDPPAPTICPPPICPPPICRVRCSSRHRARRSGPIRSRRSRATRRRSPVRRRRPSASRTTRSTRARRSRPGRRWAQPRSKRRRSRSCRSNRPRTSRTRSSRNRSRPARSTRTATATATAASEAILDPFSMPMPALRPDPFGGTPTTNAHDGMDGFVVDVAEGPLAGMSTSADETLLDAPHLDDTSANGHRDPLALEVGDAESTPTDWAGIRDAAAVADAPPEVVLGDGWGAPAIDETTPDLPTTDPLADDLVADDVETDALLSEQPGSEALTFDAGAFGEPLRSDALTFDANAFDALDALDALTPDALVPPPLERELPDEGDVPTTAPIVVHEPTPGPDAAPIAWHAEQTTTPDLSGSGTLVPVGAGQFQAAGTGWQVGGLFPATAMADDGALALRRADTRWALSDLDAPGDFTIEAVLDYSAGAGFGILFRASIDAHERVTGYSFDVDPIAGGEDSFLVRQWDDNWAHWRPIAQTTATDAADLYGRHQITLTVEGDRLGVLVDGENVLGVPALSRASIELGREPCRGGGLGVHAGATTELTVETFRAAQR